LQPTGRKERGRGAEGHARPEDKGLKARDPGSEPKGYTKS